MKIALNATYLSILLKPVSYHLERYYRSRREIARLYKPLNDDNDEGVYSDDEDMATGAEPLYPAASSAPQASSSQYSLPFFRPSDVTQKVGTGPRPPTSPLQVKNVWDDRLDVFDIGDDDDDPEARPLSGTKSKG